MTRTGGENPGAMTPAQPWDYMAAKNRLRKAVDREMARGAPERGRPHAVLDILRVLLKVYVAQEGKALREGVAVWDGKSAEGR